VTRSTRPHLLLLLLLLHLLPRLRTIETRLLLLIYDAFLRQQLSHLRYRLRLLLRLLHPHLRLRDIAIAIADLCLNR
jgi:hypothetical protein